MFGGVKRAIAWFMDGLVEALAGIGDRFSRRARLRLVPVDDGYAIEQEGGKREKTVLRLEQAGDVTRFMPPEAAAALKKRDVDLVLPSDGLLIRTLDPMPAESRSYLDGIVRHQLERLVPWRTEDVLHSYQAAPAGAKDDRLIVTIAATARSLHARTLAALSALNPAELRLLYPNVPQTGGDVAIRVDDNSIAIARLKRIRRGVVMMLSIILLVSAAGFGVLAYTGNHAAELLATAEQSVSELRQRLAARGPQRLLGRDFEAIVARKRAAPIAVAAIDALADALPDDTFLTELRIAEGRIRMTGVSRNVAELVPAIEGSPLFAEASFFAPTARLPNSQGDRFHLEARLKPAGATSAEAKPSDLRPREPSTRPPSAREPSTREPSAREPSAREREQGSVDRIDQ